MTPTERRYLEFLSHAVPRPKRFNHTRRTPAMLRRMTDLGWLYVASHGRTGPWYGITPLGETALAADKTRREFEQRIAGDD